MDVKFLFVGCLDGWIGETCGEVDVQVLPTNGWCATFKNFYLHLVQIFPNLRWYPAVFMKNIRIHQSLITNLQLLEILSKPSFTLPGHQILTV